MRNVVRLIMFVLKNATVVTALMINNPTHAQRLTPYGHDYFNLRGGLSNCQAKFERDKTGRVAFLGGSITSGGSWRTKVCADLHRRFPETKFDFINAGIPSFGSTPGAFRFASDVLSHGTVDLLFEEAAVNDSTNGQTDIEALRGMEGIVRHARLSNPAMDIVLLHFADPGKIAQVNKGEMPAVIASHERVAEQYGVVSINLAHEVSDRIRAGEFTWERDFQDLHPSEFGNALYARAVGRLFDAAWKNPSAAAVKPYPLPKPLDEKSYFRGRHIPLKDAELVSGWTIVPAWKPVIAADTREGFVNVPMLVAEKPDAELKLKFEGTAIGILVAAGPDTGTVEFSVDGGPTKSRDLFTGWSTVMYLPWAHVLAADLPPGKHELTMRIGKTNNPKSKGHAAHIAYFLAN